MAELHAAVLVAVAAEGDAAAVDPSPRKRLRVKTHVAHGAAAAADPSVAGEPVASAPAIGAGGDHLPAAGVGVVASDRRQLNYAARSEFHRRNQEAAVAPLGAVAHELVAPAGDSPDVGSDGPMAWRWVEDLGVAPGVSRRKCEHAFGQLAREVQDWFRAAAARRVGAPAGLVLGAVREHQQQQLEAQALPQLGRAFKLKSGLLTFNGPWGCLPASEGGLAAGASASVSLSPPTGDSSSSAIFDRGGAEPAEAGPLTSAFHSSSPASSVGDIATVSQHLATSVVVRQLWA